MKKIAGSLRQNRVPIFSNLRAEDLISEESWRA
jgi:hypothetical protein